MYCTKCGYKNSDGNIFCAKCGNRLQSGQAENILKTDVAVEENNEPEQAFETNVKIKETGKKTRQVSRGLIKFSTIARILLCILLVILVFTEFNLVVGRQMITKKNLGNIVSDIQLSDMKIGKLLNLDEDETLSEYIDSNVDQRFKKEYQLNEENIAELLDSDSTKLIITEYLEKISDFLLHGTSFRISSRDLVASIRKKSNKISRITGYTLNDYDYEFIQKQIEQLTGIEEINSENMTPVESAIAGGIHVIFSIALEVVLAIIIIVLLVVIVVLDVLVKKPGMYLSLSGLIPSCIFAVEQLVTLIAVPQIMYMSVGIPKSLTSVITSSMSGKCFSILVITLPVSIIVMVVTIICKVRLESIKRYDV